MPSVSVVQNGSALVITGDKLDNQVAISIDDAHNLLTVEADGVPYSFSSRQIKKITVDLGKGHDELWMGLAPGSDLLFKKGASLRTGAGDDTVTLDFWQGIGSSAALRGDLKITADTSDGQDELDADFAWKDGGVLTLVAKMGNDADAAHARMWGDITNDAEVKFDLDGGAGNDTLSTWNTYDNIDMAYGSIQVAQGSAFTILMDGGAGNDELKATYSGEMDGMLTVLFRGGAGNDLLTAQASNNNGIRMKNGSSGVVDARFYGDAGNDALGISLIQEAGSSATLANALMDGGTGLDGYHRGDTTPNLTRLNFEYAYPFMLPRPWPLLIPGVIVLEAPA